MDLWRRGKSYLVRHSTWGGSNAAPFLDASVGRQEVTLASVAYTNITAVQFNQSTRDISGFLVEVYRIAAGQSAGDTAVIPTTPASSQAPTRGRGIIKSVSGGPFSNNLGSASSNVTITLEGGTTTIGQFDVQVTWSQQ